MLRRNGSKRGEGSFLYPVGESYEMEDSKNADMKASGGLILFGGPS